MKKLGRPKKADEDKVKNHIISIDYEDYTKIRDYCLKNNVDAPVYVSYYQPESKTYVFDKPIKISELKAMKLSRKELANYLCQRCNELGKMEFNHQEK